MQLLRQNVFILKMFVLIQVLSTANAMLRVLTQSIILQIPLQLQGIVDVWRRGTEGDQQQNKRICFSDIKNFLLSDYSWYGLFVDIF